jgi:hypothetical protein
MPHFLNWGTHLNTLPYSERNKIMAFVDWAAGCEGRGRWANITLLAASRSGIILFHFYVQYKAVKS